MGAKPPGRFYAANPADSSAPVLLAEYRGYRPGDQVADHGPVAPLAGPLTVTEIWQFEDHGHGGWVTVILNDGEYEVNGDHLTVTAAGE